MQCGPMSAARVADGAKCLAGKKDRGAARKPEGREGLTGGSSPQSLVCSVGHLTVRMRGHQLQCMVKRRPKLFPARLLLSSLRGRWLPNWVGPLSLGIEHLSNEVVLYRRSNKSADKFTHV
jgi:hypothetical protein